MADLHVHDLKRYANRAVTMAGLDEVTTMRLAGWLTLSMFDRYAIRNNQDLAEGLRNAAQTARGRDRAPTAREA